MEFNELEEQIIKIISSTGISRMKELKEVEIISGSSYKEIHEIVKKLSDNNILNREIVKLGGSNGHNFYIFELSEKGKGVAESLTNKKPVISQKEVLLKEHGKIELAFLFEDSITPLKEKGIILHKNSDSYFIEINKKTYPILLDVSNASKKMFTREEYFSKLDEMWTNSSTLFYLSTNMISSKFLILDEIENWIKTRNLNSKQQKNFQFNTTYLERIIKGEGDRWDTIYELQTEGLLRWGKLPRFNW